MPPIGIASRGRSASRTVITKRNKSQIASVFRSASFVKPPSKRWKKSSAERGAKRLSEINPSATIRTTRISVGNYSIVLPLAGFISRNIFGFRTWIAPQAAYRITDFGVEAALFLIAYLSISISVAWFDVLAGGLLQRSSA